MDFGSNFVYVPAHPEEEDIYQVRCCASSAHSALQDEIDDGLAASAMEQAKIWAKAVQDEKTDFDKEFIQQLVSMVRSLTQQLPCSLFCQVALFTDPRMRASSSPPRCALTS